MDSLPAGAREAEVLLALTEDGLASSVGAGENRGRQIRHASVARSLVTLGRTTGGRFSAERTLKLESGWNKSKLSAVALVQETKTLRVLGAATARLAACSL